MARFHWDPAVYDDLVRREVHDYERLQDETVAATGSGARRILELGTVAWEHRDLAVIVGLSSWDE
ncbi:MAG: hypothetical protein ACR2LK_07355 [Solirubrobacteraceae bacterium]